MTARVWPSLLVMGLGVAAAAALQEFVPPLGLLRLKPQLLCGVAIYYAMRREWQFSAVAAAWCGLLEDSLSGVPAAVSLIFFCVAAALVYRHARPQMEEGALSCAVVGGAFAVVLSGLQYLALRLGGELSPFPAWYAAARLAAVAPIGFASALVAAWALRALDWVSANVGQTEEEDDV